jgi:hypothetical protein
MFDRPFNNPFDEFEEDKQAPVVPHDNGAPVGASSQGLIFVIALAVVLIFGAFMGGMYYAQRASAPEVEPIDLIVDGEDEDDVDEEIEEDYDSEAEEEEALEELTYVSGAAGELSISWLPLSSQNKIEMHPTLEAALYTGNGIIAEPAVPGAVIIPPELAPNAFSLGTVNGGRYDGYLLSQQISVLPGLGIYYEYFYVLDDPSGVAPSVLIDRYAGGLQEIFGAPAEYKLATEMIQRERLVTLNDGNIIIDGTVTIPELEMVENVTDTDGRELQVTGVWHRADYPNGFPTGKYVETTTLTDGRVLKLYRPADNTEDPVIGAEQFFYVREDGRLVWHDAVVPFMNPATSTAGGLLSTTTQGVPEITWADGAVNTGTYYKGQLGGCGVSKVTNVVSDDVYGTLPINTIVGTAPDGNGGVVSIYGPTSPYGYDSFTNSYNSWVNFYEADGTLEEFAALHPLIYYKDSFDRWVEMRSASVVPAAECGKPVIYLYPESEMDVDVYVSPQGGFSYTDPVYDDGWRVTAHLNGRLTNRDDGRPYPYLFWEGRGGMYSEPSNFWVVAQNDVHGFLIETLGDIGLNGREIFDFLEFWEPRMQDAAYYKIGFHGNKVMDQLAPLEMSVEPDSELRILMDYTELDVPIKAQPPKWIPRFERDGFTVVEWGGVLR